MNVKLLNICEELNLDANTLRLDEPIDDIAFCALAPCSEANEHDITFISDSKYLVTLNNSLAKAVIISKHIKVENFQKAEK